MKTAIFGLLAETPIHPGSGRTMGVIDLPVAREATTDHPVIVGSSLKGALKDKLRSPAQEQRITALFGQADQAGELLVSDGRLLLLPVRCLTGAYRWVTCPYLLERFSRDLTRAQAGPAFTLPELKGRRVLCEGEGDLFLEERQFEIVGRPAKPLVNALEQLIRHEQTRARLAGQLAILADDDFAWFARYGLTIQARNVLDQDTKQSRNLWYEETLSPDTLLYALIAARSEASLDELRGYIGADPYLQVGGNETVGQGWCVLRELEEAAR